MLSNGYASRDEVTRKNGAPLVPATRDRYPGSSGRAAWREERDGARREGDPARDEQRVGNNRILDRHARLHPTNCAEDSNMEIV